MTREEAGRQLIIGYIIAFISFCISLYLMKADFSNKFGSAGLATYCIWATYWGMKITFGFVSSIFFGNNIYYTNIWDAIKGRYSIMLWFYFALILTGYLIGVLGGGIYKQIRLMIIKYTW